MEGSASGLKEVLQARVNQHGVHDAQAVGFDHNGTAQGSTQWKDIIAMTNASNITAPTQFIETRLEKYAHLCFGSGAGLPSYVFSTLPEPWTIGTPR